MKQSQGKINILRLTCRAGASLAAFVPALGTSGGFSSSATYDIGRVYGLIWFDLQAFWGCQYRVYRFEMIHRPSLLLRTCASQTEFFRKVESASVFGLAVDGIVRISRYLGLHLHLLVKSC